VTISVNPGLGCCKMLAILVAESGLSVTISTSALP
jgi:hypothetical protein